LPPSVICLGTALAECRICFADAPVDVNEHMEVE